MIRLALELRLIPSALVISALIALPAFADSGSTGPLTDVPAASVTDTSTSSETKTTVIDPAAKVGEATGSSTSTSSSAITTKVETGSVVSSTTATTTTGNETVEGPLFEKRKLVLSKIMAAKKQGTGISGYLSEYGRIEQMVKAGDPEANYAERLSSLQSGVDEQLKRSQILKNQHPIPPSSSGFNTSFGSSGGGGGGGKIAGTSIDQLKAKYGDKVPPGIAEKLGSMTPEQRDNLLKSDLVKKLLGR